MSISPLGFADSLLEKDEEIEKLNIIVEGLITLLRHEGSRLIENEGDRIWDEMYKNMKNRDCSCLKETREIIWRLRDDSRE